jgi:hypothetical protein
LEVTFPQGTANRIVREYRVVALNRMVVCSDGRPMGGGVATAARSSPRAPAAPGLLDYFSAPQHKRPKRELRFMPSSAQGSDPYEGCWVAGAGAGAGRHCQYVLRVVSGQGGGAPDTAQILQEEEEGNSLSAAPQVRSVLCSASGGAVG